MKRILSLVAATLLMVVALAPAVGAEGAQVDRGLLDGGFQVFVSTPSGHCMTLHVQEAELMDGQPYFPLPFGPGEGNPHGNFTDFQAGGGGVPEFGLVTPSGKFVGHSPNCPDG